ncbi:MAG: hypothetical protein V7642_6669 [Burkholderiales bacterium]|jgi:hypothetical protein
MPVRAVWFLEAAYADRRATWLCLRATMGSAVPGALRKLSRTGRMKRCAKLIGLIGANLVCGTAILLVAVYNGRNCNKMVQRSD